MHGFQAKAQAAGHTNPNSPQKRTAPAPSHGRVPQTLKEGAGNGKAWQPIRRARPSTELFLCECCTHGMRITKMFQERGFLYQVNKCVVEKAFSLSLDQCFWKCGGNVVPGPAASASPGNMLEMPMTGLQPGIRNSGDGVQQSVL